jgi:hypothetical protein
MLLTIGIPTHSDYTGLYFTLLFFRRAIHDLKLGDKVRLLVVDNKPDYGGEGLKKMVENDFAARYVAMPTPEGTGPPRDRLVKEAETPWVLIIDSHVVLDTPEELLQLVEFCANNPSSNDLYYGVCMSSRLSDAKTGKRRAVWTHWRPVHGRDGLFGTSEVAQVLVDNPQHKPVRIIHSGCGLFLVRKAAFLGFHPEQRGFGAEGWLPLRYLQEKRSVWVLPFLRFFHCFRPKTIQAPYDVRYSTTARNQLLYVRDLEPNAFLTYSNVKRALNIEGRVNAKRWQTILDELGITEEAMLNRQLPERMVVDIESGGPGTELYHLLQKIGINAPPGCDCKARMAQMNVWKSTECIKNFDLIVTWMKEGHERWGWKDKLQASALAALTGLAFKISWTDPLPDLITESIRLATLKGL